MGHIGSSDEGRKTVVTSTGREGYRLPDTGMIFVPFGDGEPYPDDEDLSRVVPYYESSDGDGSED